MIYACRYSPWSARKIVANNPFPITTNFLGCASLKFTKDLEEHTMSENKPYAHIPSTISKEATELLSMLPDPHTIPPAPGPTEFEKWKVMQAASIAVTIETRA